MMQRSAEGVVDPLSASVGHDLGAYTSSTPTHANDGEKPLDVRREYTILQAFLNKGECL